MYTKGRQLNIPFDYLMIMPDFGLSQNPSPSMKAIKTSLLLVYSTLQIFHLHAQESTNSTQTEKGRNFLELARHQKETSLDSAAKYALQAYEYFSEASVNVDSQLVSGQFYVSILNALARNDEALEVVLDLIPIAKREKKTKSLAKCYSQAGKIYSEIFMYRDAQPMFQNAYSLYISHDSVKAYEQLSNMAVIKLQLKMYDEALADQRKILRYRLVNNSDKNDLATTYINIGSAFNELKKFDSAIYYFNAVFGIKKQVKPLLLQYTNHFMGRSYMQMNRLDSALKFANESHLTAKELNMPMRLVYSTSLLSEIHKLKGNYEAAYKYQTSADSLMALTFHESYAKHVTESRAKFETGEKDEEIETLSYEAERVKLKKNILIVSTSVLLIVIAVLLYFHSRKKRKLKSEVDKINRKKLKILRELEFKKNEFTSNSLNLIHKDKLLVDLKQDLNVVRKNKDLNQEATEELRLLVQKLDLNSNLEKTWREFRTHFEQVHDGFYITLSRRYPSLSDNELRFCSLIKLGLSIKETATILNISIQGVKTARYRLRKKLQLNTNESLLHYLRSIELEALEEHLN